MPLRSFLAPLAAALLVSLGISCPPKLVIQIVSPADGAVVTTASFPLEVRVSGGNADLSTVVVRINEVAVATTQGPAGTFTATIDPGDPLLDANEIRVSVMPLSSPPAYSRRAQFDYAPPKARARMITHAGDLLTGPLAHNQIGDFLLENDTARFVIQAPAKRDLHSVGQFGGNLIDAELVAHPGTDSFFEIQPSTNIETVINAQTLEILNDGQNGLPAVIRTCGPDDIIDYINASSQVASLGLNVPGVMAIIDDRDYDLDGCTEYSLAPPDRYVRMDTTLVNNGPDEVGLYVGDYINGMGTLEQWTNTGGALPLGMGEVLATPVTRAMAFSGFDTEEGVDYGLVPVQFAGGTPFSSSFSTSGVSFFLHGNVLVFVLAAGAPPTFFIPGASEKTFTRYFSVGDGSAANTVEVETEVLGLASGILQGCVTVGGTPAPGARVAVGPVSGGALTQLSAHFVTDASGCYSARIIAGNYGVAADLAGHLYEGGGGTPLVHNVTVPVDGAVVQDIDLPVSGRLRVEVVDASSNPIPARVSVVGIDPSPDPVLFATVLSFNDTRTTLFNDTTRDGLNPGFAALGWAGVDGVVELDLEPGDYQVVVSRGTEYSIHEESITSLAGSTVTVNAQIAEVVATPGFISSDYHVHLVNSPDSRISKTTRVLSFAAEGVDNIVATDHDAVTDLNPTIAALGLGAFVHGTIGEEVTSFDYGHFNAYPQAVDPSQPSGGSTDWGGAAPPGMDFPSFGNFSLTPAAIEAAAVGKAQNAGLETVVQINHIGSHFGPLQIDTALEPPASGAGLDPTLFRLDPSVTNFFHPFKALELWNGASVGHQNEFLVERIGVWMNLLNQGILVTAIADSDTHTSVDLRQAGARTWTPASSDSPAAVSAAEIGLAVKGHKAVGGQGCYVQTQLVDTQTANQADFTLGGDTLVNAADGDVDLQIEVQAPTWAEYDTIEIYRNAATTVTGTSGGVPVQYTSVPTQTLSLGAGDFVRTTVNVVPAVTGAERFETSKTLTLSGLTQDEWVVVVVKGVQGTSPPMFPVYPRSIDGSQTLADLQVNTAAEDGVRALCFTNALFADVDGNGVYDPPGVQLAP